MQSHVTVVRGLIHLRLDSYHRRQKVSKVDADEKKWDDYLQKDLGQVVL
jgi:hypothetical protein